MDIAARIKSRRLEIGISVDDVAEALSVNRATVYRYESKDIEKMPITIVQPLAKVLKTTPAYLMGWEDDAYKPEQPEPKIREKLDPDLVSIIDSCSRLNKEGQKRVSTYVADLEATGLYIRKEPLLLEERSELYTVGAAAAGQGVFNHDNENYRVFMTTEIPPHDFAVDVRGDSMFPTIYDGDVVFVKKNFETRDNQIYVLTVEDETVVKRVVFENHHLTLISDNPDWPDRVISEQDNDSVRIEGIVVGWETPS